MPAAPTAQQAESVTQVMPFRFFRAWVLAGANLVPFVVWRMAPSAPAV